MSAFESVLRLMIESGGTYVFMWLLLAALIYGVLHKYEVFGDSSANAGIALGGSFLVLIGIYVFVPESAFLNFTGVLGFSVIGLFGLIILLSLAGIDVPELAEGDSKGPVFGIAMILFIISFIGAIVYNLDVGQLLGATGNTFEEVTFPILFLVFLLAILIPAMSGGD